MEKIRDFKELRVWNKAMELVKLIYLHTKNFPKEEAYGLTSQLRRSAVSIPSNIAEGFKRYHLGEKNQFMYIASASTAELETQLLLARDLGFLDMVTADQLLEHLDHIAKMISSAIQKIRSRALV